MYIILSLSCVYFRSFVFCDVFPTTSQPEEDVEAQASVGLAQSEVKIRPAKTKKNRKKSKKDDTEFVFMDRQSIIEARSSPYPEDSQFPPLQAHESPPDAVKIVDLPSSPTKKQQSLQHPLHQVRQWLRE